MGVTKNRDVIFYQIDTEGRDRTGKIMKYNRQTGKRIKDAKDGGKSYGNTDRSIWLLARWSSMKIPGHIPLLSKG
ncbi:MAG: DUF6371 domain-containing protein [Bacteroidales bacterium]|nr:DUF6371 domain-containing protein [Bacteroidales bacterium]